MKHEPNTDHGSFEDDPRLSAYALGELDAGERAAVEALLEAEPAARAFVEELRATAAALGAGLGGEHAPGLTDGQRAVIEARAAARVGPRPILQLRNWVGVGLAAGALVWFGGSRLFAPQTEEGTGGADAAPGAEIALGEQIARLESTGAGGRETEKTMALDQMGYGAGDDAAREAVVVGRTGVDAGGDESNAWLSRSDPRPEVEGSTRFTASVEEGDPADSEEWSGQRLYDVETGVVRPQQRGELHALGYAAGTDPSVLSITPAAEPGVHVPFTATVDLPESVAWGAGGAGSAPGTPAPDHTWRDAANAPGGGAYAGPADTVAPGEASGAETKKRNRTTDSYSRDFDVELRRKDADDFSLGYGRRDEIPVHRPRLFENPFRVPRGADAFSTFSIDVDTASYANVRGYLERGGLPPAHEVRIEELVNYFPYAYAPPTGEHPFAVHVEVGQAPWHPEHRLLRVGIKAREVERQERQPSNLVFLLDVSGSMSPANKLPLLRSSLEMLVGQLDERDHVGIVTYAGTSGVHLPSTNADQKDTLLASIRALRAGGSTNGEAGIQLAYQMAEANRVEGVNRVILATDGDFNVGMSNDSALTALIADKAESGVFLTVLGFGTGNFKDARLEAISGRGNGTFHYIDSQLEAKKVLVDELSGTLETVAKDVKIQLDFNPLEVAGYRLIGYENRVLANRDFLDDTKDAGEVGAGHQVTALYEIVPAGRALATGAGGVEPSRYQEPAPVLPPQAVTDAARTGEMLTVRLRYKQPDAAESTGFEVHVSEAGRRFAELGPDTRFAASVAAFGMLLRGSQHSGSADMRAVFDWAMNASGEDPHGYRREFLKLVEKAMHMRGGR